MSRYDVRRRHLLQVIRGHGNGGRIAVGSLAMIATAMVIAAIAAAAFLTSSTTDTPNQPGEVELQRNLACPHLLKALAFHDLKDEPEFDAAISRAARVAEQTLRRSGQLFSRPERAALELRSSIEKGWSRRAALIADLLREAEEACPTP